MGKDRPSRTARRGALVTQRRVVTATAQFRIFSA